MKEFFSSKKNIAITVSVAVVAIILAVIIGVTHNKKAKTEPEITVPVETTVEAETTEEATEETTVEETEKETEKTTEKTAPKPAAKPQQKPNKPAPKPAPKPSNNKPANNGDRDKEAIEVAREHLYKKYGGKEGYEKHVEKVKNYKCPYCGKHDCPGLEYGRDAFGNPTGPSIKDGKCPDIMAGKVKCPHCGKTQVGLDDPRLADKEHYCDGFCHISFG